MKIQPFQLERWQSIWENRVEINISESGVQPLTVEELVEDPKQLQALLRTPLGYPQTNGSPQTRSRVAELYPGARAENVLMTTGCAEANHDCVDSRSHSFAPSFIDKLVWGRRSPRVAMSIWLASNPRRICSAV